MKRTFILFTVSLFFFSLLLITPLPVEAITVQTEAVWGEPFGVCRVELPLPPTEQEIGYSSDEASLFEIIHQASVYESNKRALYPVWSINSDRSDTSSSNKTLLFFFQGLDEFDVLISRTGFKEFTEKVKIKPIINEELHKSLLEEWWSAYVAKLEALHSLDFYDPSVELGIASMMARRLDLPLSNLRNMLRNYYNSYDYIFGLLLGTESIRLAMQSNTMLETKDKSEIADRDLPEAASPPAIPIPHFDDDKVKVEPLAMRAPQECFYLRFGSFSTFLEARDFLDRWGTVFRSTLSSRSAGYDISSRIEQQLALRETALSRLFGSSVINDVAIIGADTFLREGAAIGVLFQAKQNDLLKNQLDSIRSDILKESPSVRESSEIINGRATSLLLSPGNEVRSFYVQDGDFHLVTTSKWMVEAFLATEKAPDLSLGSLKEFRYARSRINSSEQGIFIYLSDPFFRNLVGPAYRVEMTRRAQSVSELQMLSLARLAAVQEGLASPSVTSLIEKEFLPKGFGTRHDKSQPVLEEDGTATDSIRGAIGSFLPIPDTTIDKITSSEEEAYKYFADEYSDLWTNMDPVFGLLDNKKESTGEHLELKLNISPYAKSRYEFFSSLLGEPSFDRIAAISGDLISLEARVDDNTRRRLTQKNEGLHFFGGLQDTNIPWTIRHCAINTRELAYNVERLINFYVGLKVSPNFDEDSLGFFFSRVSEPDAEGYAELSGFNRLLSRRFGSYYIIGTGRPLLETVSPSIRIEKAEHPSQLSLNLGDLSKTSLGKYLRAEAYARDRRISAGNALLLHAYQQQLQPNDMNGAVKAVQNQSLICPLGGTFAPADKEQPDRWKSTAWDEATLYQTNQMPNTYHHAIVDGIETMRLEFTIDPDTLKTRLEIQTK